MKAPDCDDTDARSLLRTQVITLVLFLAAEVLYALFSIPDRNIGGSDVQSYVDPARALAEFGRYYCSPEDLTPCSQRPPLYPAFLAVHIAAFGVDTGLQAAIVSQTALLYVTSLLIFLALRNTHGAATASAAQILFLFNLNSFTTAHLIESEALLSVLSAALFATLWQLSIRLRGALLMAGGILVALATLTKPIAIILIPAIVPVTALLFFASHKHGQGGSKRALVYAVLSTIIAGSGVSLWMERNRQQVGAFVVNTHTFEFLADQVRELSYARKLLGDPDWESASRKNMMEEVKQSLPDMASRPEVEIERYVAPLAIKRALEQPLSAHLVAGLTSLVRMFASGGGSKLREPLGVTCGHIAETEGLAAFLADLRSATSTTHASCIVLSYGLPVATALATRVLAIIGVVALWRARNWRLLLIAGGYVLAFTLPVFYMGQARYRIPLEPTLAVLAGIGVIAAWRHMYRRVVA